MQTPCFFIVIFAMYCKVQPVINFPRCHHHRVTQCSECKRLPRACRGFHIGSRASMCRLNGQNSAADKSPIPRNNHSLPAVQVIKEVRKVCITKPEMPRSCTTQHFDFKLSMTHKRVWKILPFFPNLNLVLGEGGNSTLCTWR